MRIARVSFRTRLSSPIRVRSNDCRFERKKKKNRKKRGIFKKKSKQSKTFSSDRNGKMLASLFYPPHPPLLRSLSIDPSIIGFASNPQIFQRSRRQTCRKGYESCRVIPKSRSRVSFPRFVIIEKGIFPPREEELELAELIFNSAASILRVKTSNAKNVEFRGMARHASILLLTTRDRILVGIAKTAYNSITPSYATASRVSLMLSRFLDN